MIRNIIKSLKLEKQKVRKLSRFLMPGYYFFNNGEIIKFSLKNIFRLHRIIHVKKKDDDEKYSNYVSGYYGFGAYKYVFMNKQDAFLCFLKESSYLKAKNNYLLYEKELLTPHVAFKNFDDENHIIISDRAIGKKHQCDSDNNYFVINVLLNNYLSNHINIIDKEIELLATKKTIPFIIQHGDFQYHNLIWNDGAFKAVDLDNIDYYPFFYDIFFYLLSCPSNTILKALNQNSHLFRLFFDKIGMQNLSIDECFDLFVEYIFLTVNDFRRGHARFVMRLFRNHETDIAQDYPLTKKAIEYALSIMRANGLS